MKAIARIATGVLVLALAGPAFAQSTRVTVVKKEVVHKKPKAFVEASGTYGFSFGVQPYVPEGTPTDTRHPVTTGFGGGGTAGFMVTDDIAVIANYEYSQASSRTGFVTNVLDEVEGQIKYHTVVAGGQIQHRVGPGRLFAELALGVVMPFSTQLEYKYADAMAGLPDPVMGTGVRTSDYNVGFGGHGRLGYAVNLGTSGAYMSLALKLRTFQSNNDDKEVRLDNFVTDFNTLEAVNMTTTFSNESGNPPNTYSVQDFRAHIGLGYQF